MRHYASAMYAVVVCPSVCLSVCHKLVMCGKWWDESSGILARRLLHLSYTVFLKILVPPSTSSWNFVTNTGHRKFHHGKSIVLSTKLTDGQTCQPHLQQLLLMRHNVFGSVTNCTPWRVQDLPTSRAWHCNSCSRRVRTWHTTYTFVPSLAGSVQLPKRQCKIQKDTKDGKGIRRTVKDVKGTSETNILTFCSMTTVLH